MNIVNISPNPFMTMFEKFVEGVKFQPDCNKQTDIIYCGSLSKLKFALSKKKKWKKPIVCWVWDVPDCWREWAWNKKDIAENAYRDDYWKENLKLLKQCDRILCGSKSTQKALKNYEIESEQLYYYINTEAIKKVRGKKKQNQFIQISRFALNKRFEDSIITAQSTNKTLICVGSGKSYLSRLQKFVKCETRIFELLSGKKKKSDIYFKHAPDTPTVISLLKSSKILVSPSIFEGWGITPIEALFCGVPVILSDLEVFQEVYGDKVLYHRQKDPEDQAEKLNFLWDDTDLQNKIVRDCQPIIAEFTPQKFAKRWKEAICVL